jgi:hypothetical protein
MDGKIQRAVRYVVQRTDVFAGIVDIECRGHSRINRDIR